MTMAVMTLEGMRAANSTAEISSETLASRRRSMDVRIGAGSINNLSGTETPARHNGGQFQHGHGLIAFDSQEFQHGLSRFSTYATKPTPKWSRKKIRKSIPGSMVIHLPPLRDWERVGRGRPGA